MRMRRWFAATWALGVLTAGCGGSTTSSSGAPNACGGDESLRYQDAATEPAAPCGPCGDGVIVCASPNALVCVGESPASACADASDAGSGRDGFADASPRDATIADANDGAVEDGALEGGGGLAADGTAADGASADANTGDASAKNGGLADASVADTSVADTSVADTSVADTSVADTSVAEAADGAILGFPVADGGPGWATAPDASIEVVTLSNGGLPAVECLALAANDLVFDPVRTLLYASLSSTSPAFGNSVVRIDPTAVAVTGTVFAGSNPGALDLSDDASSLYVGLDGSASVLRIDPATGHYDAPVYLGASSFEGPRTARVIRAVPGSSSRYVVSREVSGYSPSFAGLALYDGEALLGEWNGFTGGESIAFTSPSLLFGYNNEDTGFDLVEFDVTSAGFQQTSSTSNLISGFSVTITAQGGWIFATSGQVVDSATTQPAGRYAASGPVWPSDDQTNVWFLTSGPTLEDFDRTTFLPVRTIALPAGAGSGTPASLIGLSSTTFAYRTATNVCVVTIAP